MRARLQARVSTLRAVTHHPPSQPMSNAQQMTTSLSAPSSVGQKSSRVWPGSLPGGLPRPKSKCQPSRAPSGCSGKKCASEPTQVLRVVGLRCLFPGSCQLGPLCPWRQSHSSPRGLFQLHTLNGASNLMLPIPQTSSSSFHEGTSSAF